MEVATPPPWKSPPPPQWCMTMVAVKYIGLWGQISSLVLLRLVLLSDPFCHQKFLRVTGDELHSQMCVKKKKINQGSSRSSLTLGFFFFFFFNCGIWKFHPQGFVLFHKTECRASSISLGRNFWNGNGVLSRDKCFLTTLHWKEYNIWPIGTMLEMSFYEKRFWQNYMSGNNTGTTAHSKAAGRHWDLGRHRDRTAWQPDLLHHVTQMSAWQLKTKKNFSYFLGYGFTNLFSCINWIISIYGHYLFTMSSFLQVVDKISLY